METNNLTKEFTEDSATSDAINKVFEANRAVIALAYSEGTYTNLPPTDVQSAVASLLAPLMAAIIMKGNNFVLRSVLSTNQPISIADFKEEVADAISSWEETIRAGKEFAATATRVQ